MGKMHPLRTVWRRSKLNNEIWHSGHYRHIINDRNENLPSLLFLSTNSTLSTLLILAVRRTCVVGAHHGVSVVQWLEHRSGKSEGLRFDSSWGLRIFFFVPRSWQDEKKPSFSIINDVTLLWTTTRFWATNATFPCDHQNQVDKPQLDVMRDVIVGKFSPCDLTWCFAGSTNRNQSELMQRIRMESY